MRADGSVAVHDRILVLIDPKDFGRWLSGEAGTELLRPVPVGGIEAREPHRQCR